MSAIYDEARMEVTLMWDPPLKPNGVITGYRARFTLANQAQFQHETWLGPDARQYKYAVSVLCRSYEAKVAAATGAALTNFSIKEFNAISPGMLACI